MATRFGVSRPVLRQALARLKQEDVIHATRGSGNFVAQEQQATLCFAPLQSIPDVQRCLEFRLALESQAAAIAAERRSEQNLARLQAAWERFRDAIISGEEVVDADFDFHMAVAEATNSQYYVLTLKALRPHIVFGINLVRTLSSKANASQVLEEHEQVVRAIRTADPLAARQAMADHLQAGIKRLFP
jgi:DNA-binding FadR family transcriptional regulator